MIRTATALLVAALLPLAGPATDRSAAAAPHRARQALPLGAGDLPERRSTVRLRPGVTMTTITRGVADTTDTWTVEVSSPDASDPDPDAPAVALTDRAEADRTAASLRTAGLDPRVEPVATPRTADTGGLLGYRVRVGAFATKAQAAATSSRVTAAGLTPSTLYTGWDDDAGAAPSRGTWRLHVLRVDPRRFTGRVRGGFGPDLVDRETTSQLARTAHAVAATNAGFFVLDPAAGAPGDPAGVGVYRGRILSETTDGRPALLLHADGRARIQRLWWRGSVRVGSRALRLAGLNRVPGKVRNCGARGLTPTSRPQQDVTCTRASDLVAFDRSYAATSPTGVAAEVVLGRGGRVLAVDRTGGARIPRHGRIVAATGRAASRLLALARPGRRLHVTSRLVDARRHRLRLTRDLTVLNGAPVLVRHGRLHATPGRDGAVHPGEPSFYYGWAHKRNPRTFAGIDARGRLVVVTADGRSTDSLG